MKIIAIYVVVIIAVLGIGYWLFHSSQTTNQNLAGTAYPILGRNHIDVGTHPQVPYNSNPPTSGDHYPNPANWGVYKTTLPDEQVVHNLEHGGIWISYKANVDADTVAKLEDFAKRYQLVVVEPRDADDTPIAFSSWGYLEKFDHYDEASMVKFIEDHYNKGPEKVQ